MPTAIIGQPFTFQVFFLDAMNNPLVVTGPMTKVFWFNSAGVELVISSGPMMPIPGDPGRYQYTFTVPSTMGAGTTIYGFMSGLDPETLTVLLIEESADLIYNPVSAGGINARFIR